MTLKSSGRHLKDGLDHQTLHRRMVRGPDGQFYATTMIYGKINQVPAGETESLTYIIFIAIRYDLVGWLR